MNLREFALLVVCSTSVFACKSSEAVRDPDQILSSAGESLVFQSPATCPAFVARDIEKCDAADCRGILSGNLLRCGTGDCTAIVRRDPTQCGNADCKALAAAAQGDPETPAQFSGAPATCESAACRAVLSGSAKSCPD